MDNVYYFIDLFKSIADYRKIVLLIFSIKNDIYFLEEFGFVKSDTESLNLDFISVLSEQFDEYHSLNQ